MAKKWQPPPMGPKKTANEPNGGVKVDEQVVRKVLKVNPDLREGRTTLQVKKALERGESLAHAAKPSSRATPNAPVASAITPATSNPARQLSETLDFFMTTKQRELSGQLGEIAERRRLLDQEEAALRADTKRKLANFMAMLDSGVIAIHGKKALQSHRELLSSLGVTATDLLDAVKRGDR